MTIQVEITCEDQDGFVRDFQFAYTPATSRRRFSHDEYGDDCEFDFLAAYDQTTGAEIMVEQSAIERATDKIRHEVTPE